MANAGWRVVYGKYRPIITWLSQGRGLLAGVRLAIKKGRDLILGQEHTQRQTELLPKPPQSSSTGRGSSPQFFLTHQTSHGSPSRGKITPASLLNQAGFLR